MANAPVLVLETVQAGFEATLGTPVAATRVVDFLPGKALLKRNIGTIAIPRAGSRSGPYQAYPGVEDVELDVEFDASTDDWPWWMNLFLAPLTTGTGAGTAKTYSQTPSDTIAAIGPSASAVQSATFEVGGKDTWPSAFQIAGVIGKTLSLTITPENVWSGKATLMGMLTAQHALTGSLSNRAIAAYATGPQTKVFLDSTLPFGTTQLVGRGVSADWTLDLRPVSRHTLDGTTTPYRLALPEAYQIKCKLTAEFSALTEYNAWSAKTAQRLQLIYTGAAIAGGGNHAITLNHGGVWNTLDIVDDKNIWAITMETEQLFDSSISAALQSIAVNTVSPLP